MKCSEIEFLMMKYLDGDINDIENLNLKQHLKICKKCSEDFEILKSTINIIEIKENIAPPKDFEKMVIDKIAKEKSVKFFKKFNPKYILLALSINLFLIISFYYLLWKYLFRESKLLIVSESLVWSFFNVFFKSYSAFINIVINFAYEYYYFLVLFIVILYGLERLISVKLNEIRKGEM